MSDTNCLICNHQLQAQIEAEWIQGEKSLLDVAAIFDGEMDEHAVLMHFETHPTAVEKAAEEKQVKRRLNEVQNDKEPTTVPSPMVQSDDGSLELLQDMMEVLKQKFNDIILTKQISGLTQVSKEIRETMREIERVKKKRKASMADRSDELLAEHRHMNRYLLHNLCEECITNYRKFLTETTYTG